MSFGMSREGCEAGDAADDLRQISARNGCNQNSWMVCPIAAFIGVVGLFEPLLTERDIDDLDTNTITAMRLLNLLAMPALVILRGPNPVDGTRVLSMRMFQDKAIFVGAAEKKQHGRGRAA
jgi:hypothetical protein